MGTGSALNEKKVVDHSINLKPVTAIAKHTT